MKTISAPPEMEPSVELECECSHRFWVDPCGEENLEWSEKHRSLKAVCPSCGKREEDESYGKNLKTSDIVKSRISGYVIGTGFVLAAPFMALAALFIAPAIYLSGKIHECSYGHKELYDAQSGEHYRLCTTCGDKVISGDND